MKQKANNQIFLLTEFNEWLSGQVTAHVASNYPSWLKKLDREFISTLKTGSKYTPLQKLEKFMTSSKNGPKIKLIQDLLEAINSRLNGKLGQIQDNKSESINEFRSERTAFRRYAEFIIEYVASHPHRHTAPTPTEEAVTTTINGENIIWDKDDMVNNFALRIDTQDRPTGNKTLLPLGLIRCILGKGKLRQWSKAEAEKVLIHLDNRTVTVANIDQLTINTQTGQTTVLVNNVWEEVFNPPINNKKEPLCIFKLDDAHLDHDPEIDTVLRDLDGQLPYLEILTIWILDKKEKLGLRRIDTKNCDSIYSEILNDVNFQKLLTQQFKEDLFKEIEEVSSNHKLQLASSKWNQSTKKQAKKTKTSQI